MRLFWSKSYVFYIILFGSASSIKFPIRFRISGQKWDIFKTVFIGRELILIGCATGHNILAPSTGNSREPCSVSSRAGGHRRGWILGVVYRLMEPTAQASGSSLGTNFGVHIACKLFFY